jgi:ankyrin repeat protein
MAATTPSIAPSRSFSQLRCAAPHLLRDRLNLTDEVRRIVARTLRRWQVDESQRGFQRPLHFAVRKNRPQMVALLLELGADPLATDGSGYPAAAYATAPDIDRSVMEMIRARGGMDLLTAVALRDWETAGRLLRENPGAVERAGASAGVLHLMAKRGDAAAVKWLLDHNLDPDARWSHWDAEVTSLHLAV